MADITRRRKFKKRLQPPKKLIAVRSLSESKEVKMKTHKKLTSTERTLLAAWKKEGLSNKKCGRRLGRDVSTIGRELKRNGFKNKTEGIYI